MTTPFSRGWFQKTLATTGLLALVFAACSSDQQTGNLGGGSSTTVNKKDAGADGGPTDAGTGADSAGTGGAGGNCAPASSPGLSAACATCEKDVWTETFVEDVGADYYAACYATTDKAKAGPAKDRPKAQLCKELVDCIHRTGCGLTGNWSCYCGEKLPGESDEDAQARCQKPGGAVGLCRQEIEYASETTASGDVGARKFNPMFAAGAAQGLLFFVDYPAQVPGNPDGPCVNACTATTAAVGAVGCSPGGTGSGGAGGNSATSTGGAGNSGGVSGSGGRIGGGGTTGQAGAPVTYAFDPACQTCQLESTSDFCADHTLLSAVTRQDPDTGESLAVGWGPDTLPTPAQRDAALALVHTIFERKCSSTSINDARPGNFPQSGCLLNLGQSPAEVGLGAFATDPTFSALPEYEAAALADAQAGPVPGGVPPGSTNEMLGAYLAAHAGDSTSAVGLANNIAHCALDGACEACLNMIVTTSCSNGAADGCGSTGGSGAGGASDSNDGGAGAGGNGGADGGNNGGAGGRAGAGGGGGAGGRGGGAGFGGAGGRGGQGGAAGTAGGSAGSNGGASVGGRGGQGTGLGGSGGCAGLDIDQDGVPDCQQQLLANPDFQQNVSGWTPAPNSRAAWTASDGRNSAQSGGVRVTNTDTSPDHAVNGWNINGAFQCVPVIPGLGYVVAVQAFLPAGQGQGWAGYQLDYFPSNDCTGSPVGLPFVSAQVTATDAWQTIAGTTTAISLGIKTVAVRLAAVKPTAQTTFSAVFDNVLFRVK